MEQGYLSEPEGLEARAAVLEAKAEELRGEAMSLRTQAEAERKRRAGVISARQKQEDVAWAEIETQGQTRRSAVNFSAWLTSPSGLGWLKRHDLTKGRGEEMYRERRGGRP